jgi:hypothetical protein
VNYELYWVAFQVLAAVSMKMVVFWDVAPFSLVEIYRRFRGSYCLHHQAMSGCLLGVLRLVVWYHFTDVLEVLTESIIRTEGEGSMFLRDVGIDSTRRYDPEDQQ